MAHKLNLLPRCQWGHCDGAERARAYEVLRTEDRAHLETRVFCQHHVVLAVSTYGRDYTLAAVVAERTSCKSGHVLTDDNLYVTPDGRRQCVQCGLARNKKHRDRLRGRA